TKIPKGSKVNPQAQDSAVYKEDVVKLEAPMKAGGSVTYSSNGDGSINVYNSIPYKWESPQNSDYSQMDKITRKAIEDNVETTYINHHDNKTVAKLANKVTYNIQLHIRNVTVFAIHFYFNMFMLFGVIINTLKEYVEESLNDYWITNC